MVAKVTKGSVSFRLAFGFAWSTYRKRYLQFTAVMLTFVGGWAALEIVVVAGQRFGLAWWVTAHIAFLFLFAGIEAGFVRTCLVLCDGGEPTFGDTFAYLSRGPRFLAGQLVCLILVVGGLLLLVVPGVYLGARYAFFAFLLAAGDGIAQSFRQSAIGSTGVKARLLVILLGLSLLNVLGASLLGLGLLITAPLSVLILAAIYRQLSAVPHIAVANRALEGRARLMLSMGALW